MTNSAISRRVRNMLGFPILIALAVVATSTNGTDTAPEKTPLRIALRQIDGEQNSSSEILRNRFEETWPNQVLVRGTHLARPSTARRFTWAWEWPIRATCG